MKNSPSKIDTVKGPFSRIKFEPFNLNSDKQIKDYLLKQGWVPTQWNYQKKNGKMVYDSRGRKIKTSPKLTEDSYSSIEGDIPKLIARRNILVHRRRTIHNENDSTKGWLNKIRPDGRIEAQGIPQATNTGRYRHSIIVNVPKADPKVVYGKEMRELFIVPEDKDMVGVDAKKLEATLEAHYCYQYTGGHDYAEELLKGDIHKNNAIIFGTDRDGAKAPKYGLTYGCSPPKLREILGCSKVKAEEFYKNFWEGNTALKELRDNLGIAYKQNNGFIKGLDGRKLFIRSPHALVNTIIQSAGSICVKAAMCYLWIRLIPKYEIDAKLLIQQHDEFQAEVEPLQTELYIKLAHKSFEKAGEYFNLNVPLECSAIVGRNWSETH